MKSWKAAVCGVIFLIVIFVILGFVVLGQCAWADYIPPGEVEVKTASYQPVVSVTPEQQYQYEISWQGIPVADALVRTTSDNRGGEPLMRVEAFANTGNAIDMLYRLRHRTLSVFKVNTFESVRYSSRQTENSKERVRQVTFGRNGKIRAKLFKNGEKDEVIEFKSSNRTLDPVAAAFLARSLPIKVGEKFSFDVFNGKHRFLITFDVVGREVVNELGAKRFAFKVVPQVKKLTDSKGEDRLKSATIWISDDEKRDILRLESRVWIGSVVAKLVQVGPSSETPLHLEVKDRLVDKAALVKLGNL